MVVEINTEKDYNFSDETKEGTFPPLLIKFLTSERKSTNLKYIMAFSDDYLKKNEKDILHNYYKYCEKILYSSPLYCSTKPTSELENNFKADINRYFWLIVKCDVEECTPIFWLSAVSEGGILLFIKVRARISRAIGGYDFTLLQQTTYYRSKDKLCPLYR
ncbi:hypothetical protein GPL15_21095 [Clostridium sp. MCC353]|uniref:hypothetical protein n=1 Tax=Clostridium sp. MCC353 TaxID=2592646 RepID=UPI001C014EA5|nr:hypothetical protein [Clostridium sp. MCC353]MBT9778977.1 hypothetical protein [Clostridium sp. MCC353]